MRAGASQAWSSWKVRACVREALRRGVRLERRGRCARDAPNRRPLRPRRDAQRRAPFERLTQTVTPQGVMAIARRARRPRRRGPRGRARRRGWPLVVLDGVQDPGNVGAICRTAAAAGAPALAVLDGTADPFGAKAVRASAGQRLPARRSPDGRLERPRRARRLRCRAPRAVRRWPRRRSRGAGMIVLGSEAHGLRASDLRLVTVPLARGGRVAERGRRRGAVLLFEVRGGWQHERPDRAADKRARAAVATARDRGGAGAHRASSTSAAAAHHRLLVGDLARSEPAERPRVGQAANEAKQAIEAALGGARRRARAASASPTSPRPRRSTSRSPARRLAAATSTS